jgi:hypothetical protein
MHRGLVMTLPASPNSALERSTRSAMLENALGARNSINDCASDLADRWTAARPTTNESAIDVFLMALTFRSRLIAKGNVGAEVWLPLDISFPLLTTLAVPRSTWSSTTSVTWILPTPMQSAPQRVVGDPQFRRRGSYRLHATAVGGKFPTIAGLCHGWGRIPETISSRVPSSCRSVAGCRA